MATSAFVTSSELNIQETAGTISESISRSGSLDGEVTVTYGITGDTATAGQDFVGGTGTTTIPSGVSQINIPIQISNDTLSEPTETFVFSLISATGGTISAPRTSRISILDDETPVAPPSPEPPRQSKYIINEVPLVSGLDQPVRFVFSPISPSQVLVAEKPGVIAIADLRAGTSTTLLDLRNQVNNNSDRGLLDIALHPDFVHNPYIYAFIVVDPPDTAGQVGAAGPDGAGNRYSQVMRYTADASTGYTSTLPGSGVILLGGAGTSLGDISGSGAQDFTDPAFASAPASDRYINPNGAIPPVVINSFKQNYLKVDSAAHAGGHLSFGPDGALYVSVGEGTSFNYTDPHALDVQSLDSLSGKILRIDPMTGRGLSDNPFATGSSLDSNRAKVFQLGLRNPFSMTFDQDGRLFIADTGWYSYEEINVAGPGANFGWPFYEGGDGGVLHQTPNYRDLPAATDFYNAVAAGTIQITPPFRAFSRNSADPGFQIQAITAGEVIYSGNVYPTSLKDNFIFADYVAGDVYTINVNDRSDVKFLYNSNGPYAPLDFVEGADGYIYYSDLTSGVIGRLDISATTPTIGSDTINVVNSATGQPITATAVPYTGPVAGIQNEYINVTPVNLNVAVATGNWFIHSGPGTDAIAAHSGINVIDGGTGSNFLTGGSGSDMFFIDDRGATTNIWSTLVSFGAGDACTFWGIDPTNFSLNWVDNEGAAGFTGLTLHATSASGQIASMTLVGFTTADLNSGRVSTSFGNDPAPASDSNYLFVKV